jgi:hypothetical protein
MSVSARKLFAVVTRAPPGIHHDTLERLAEADAFAVLA